MLSSSAETIVFTGLSGCFARATTPREIWKAILRKRDFFMMLPETSDGHTADELFDGCPLPEACASLDDCFSCRVDHIPLPPDLGIGDNTDFWFAAQLLHNALCDAGLQPGTKQTDRISLYVGYDAGLNPALVNWLWHANAVGQILGTLHRFFPDASYEQMDALRTEITNTLPLLKRRQLELARGDGVVRALAQTIGACDTASLCTAGESSVFAGLEAASNALRQRQCDVAVVLALQPPIPQTQMAGEAALMPFCKGMRLAPFTQATTGTLPGEGGAAFVLRRLDDARASDSPIYAKLHGCSQISGIPPESPEALEESLRRALHRALRRIPNGFRDIDYWEMNASGIPMEDAAEEALLKRLTVNRGAHIPLLALGSAKTSFGHTMTAAGALGLLKGILAVSHRVLPPSVTPVDESFRLKEAEQAYYWVQEARPWIASSTRPRRLAVSTISHTGRSGAAILEEVNE